MVVCVTVLREIRILTPSYINAEFFSSNTNRADGRQRITADYVILMYPWYHCVS